MPACLKRLSDTDPDTKITGAIITPYARQADLVLAALNHTLSAHRATLPQNCSVETLTAAACQSKTYDVVVPAFDHMFEAWTRYARSERLVHTVISRTRLLLAVPALWLPKYNRAVGETEVLSGLWELKVSAKEITFTDIAINLCSTEWQADKLLREWWASEVFHPRDAAQELAVVTSHDPSAVPRGQKNRQKTYYEQACESVDFHGWEKVQLLPTRGNAFGAIAFAPRDPEGCCRAHVKFLRPGRAHPGHSTVWDLGMVSEFDDGSIHLPIAVSGLESWWSRSHKAWIHHDLAMQTVEIVAAEFLHSLARKLQEPGLQSSINVPTEGLQVLWSMHKKRLTKDDAVEEVAAGGGRRTHFYLTTAPNSGSMVLAEMWHSVMWWPGDRVEGSWRQCKSTRLVLKLKTPMVAASEVVLTCWNALGQNPQVAWVPSLPDVRSGPATSQTLPRYPPRENGLDSALDAVIAEIKRWHLETTSRDIPFERWYRQAARAWHPDKNPDKKELASAVMKWLNEFKDLQPP